MEKQKFFYLGKGSKMEELREYILDIMDGKKLGVEFQPIYSRKQERVYGYEALTRIKKADMDFSIQDFFKVSVSLNIIESLDFLCRENAIRESSLQNIKAMGAHIFINICPETLMSPTHRSGLTDEIAENWHIPKEKIILEITEESAIKNYALFKKALEHYRDAGYKVAIDDFGAGYGGLKMLSIIEPDFIKIDRHFISNINKNNMNHNLVDAIVTSCNKIGIAIIAEGIETEAEYETLAGFGIDLLQGYFISKPSPVLENVILPKSLTESPKKFQSTEDREVQFVGEIAFQVEPLDPEIPMIEVFRRFVNNSNLRCLPIVKKGRLLGLLDRNRFFEEKVLGKLGYAMSLNSYKKVKDFIGTPPLVLDKNLSIEEIAPFIKHRNNDALYDDICITSNGEYFGIVTIHSLLSAISEKSIKLARGCNPLSGLPGNEFIYREINKRISQKIHFDVIYMDIDNFKPFNDNYGFDRGDMVIKGLADIITESLERISDGFSFAGHIGGDDFIILARSQDSETLAGDIITKFEKKLQRFHGQIDFENKFYYSKNRKGEEEKFALLSLSLGIVSTGLHNFQSIGEIASVAAEVKKAAKKIPGSALVSDRRNNL